MEKTRLSRKESAFGLHFDFHAGEDSHHIGARMDESVLRRLIEEVRPDFIQCDTKGHAGVSSYPTKFGHPAPDMDGDILQMWRSVTKECGVALYAHHSGIWDNAALAEHPQWAAVDRDGKASSQKISVFGPYADERLIPQLVEMGRDYGLDGAWIDGECWAVLLDFSEYALRAWKEETGKDGVADEDMEAYRAFNRRGFIRYVAHVAEEVHKTVPGFQITSNWLYSSHVPEKVSIPLDYLSGDYSPNEPLWSARYEGRCIQAQDKPWDLMAWGFSWYDGYVNTKEAAQMEQEAAVVLALGGGFQVYNTQLEDSIQDWIIPNLKQVAEFYRAREEYSHGSKPIAQVCVVNSTAAYYSQNNPNILFPINNDVMRDAASNTCYLLDNQLSVEVRNTALALDKLNQYGLVVLPDCPALEPELMAEIKAYVQRGGRLILSGPHAVRLFQDELGICVDEISEKKTVYFSIDGSTSGVTAHCGRASGDMGRILSYVGTTKSQYDEKTPLAGVKDYGRGKIAYSLVELGDTYRTQRTANMRRLMGALVDAAGYEPLVRVTGSHLVEVSVMTMDYALNIHLTNLAGQGDNAHVMSFDEVPSIGPLKLALAPGHLPKKVMLEPEHKELSWHMEGEYPVIELDNLHIHGIVRVFL